MSSREDILGRVRARLQSRPHHAVPPAGRPSGRKRPAEAAPTFEALLAARKHGPKPLVDPSPAALLARFKEKSAAMSSTVEQVASRAAVPAAVARYLAAMQLPTQAVAHAPLADLDWAGAGITIEVRGARDADLVGITGCFCAVAETGTLMLCSSPDTPAAVSLLPETHIAIVDASRIVPHMENAWDLARAEFGRLPRAVNFISGPSRTGDIEQTIVLGAHGPYRVHIVIVATSSTRES